MGDAEIWDKKRQPCTVEGCTALARGLGLCEKHYRHQRAYGTTELLGLPTGERHPAWTGNEASYDAIHQRLRKQRGRAALLACNDCGKPARQWSYNGPSRERLPSDPNLMSYVPRCVSCHKKHDLARLVDRVETP